MIVRVFISILRSLYHMPNLSDPLTKIVHHVGVGMITPAYWRRHPNRTKVRGDHVDRAVLCLHPKPCVSSLEAEVHTAGVVMEAEGHVEQQVGEGAGQLVAVWHGAVEQVADVDRDGDGV